MLHNALRTQNSPAPVRNGIDDGGKRYACDSAAWETGSWMVTVAP
jgi:hypothetical protein